MLGKSGTKGTVICTLITRLEVQIDMPQLAHQMAEKIRPRLPDVVAGWGFDELESVVSREGRESPDNYCRARKRRRAD